MTIKQLENKLRRLRGKHSQDVFLLEDGSEYMVDNAIGWLFEHGTETPGGRIVAYQHPETGVDALTLSIYETIDEAIQKGGFQHLIK